MTESQSSRPARADTVPSVIYIQSYRIWAAAADARDRARKIVDENSQDVPFDAIVAIVLAAAATEAFINEVAAVIQAELSSVYGATRLTSQMKALADALDEVEDSNGSLALKYVIAGHVLGRPYDRGANPFQDFALLMRLRNDAMHLKQRDRLIAGAPGGGLGEHSMEWPKHIAALQQRGLARRVDTPNTLMGSFDALQTPEIAAWACNAADRMIRSILDQFPSDISSPTLVLHRTYNPPWGRRS